MTVERPTNTRKNGIEARAKQERLTVEQRTSKGLFKGRSKSVQRENWGEASGTAATLNNGRTTAAGV